MFPDLFLQGGLQLLDEAGEVVGFRVSKAQVQHGIGVEVGEVDLIFELVLQVVDKHFVTGEERLDGLVGHREAEATGTNEHKEVLVRQAWRLIEVVDEVFELTEFVDVVAVREDDFVEVGIKRVARGQSHGAFTSKEERGLRTREKDAAILACGICGGWEALVSLGDRAPALTIRPYPEGTSRQSPRASACYRYYL